MYLNGFKDGSDALCDRFNRMLALYYVGSLYHSGQWSVLYRLMCRSEVKPGASWRGTLDRQEDSEARHYAARYLRAARKRGIV